MKHLTKIAFGGGCHWCTEAVFQHLKGVDNVEQGFVASTKENSGFSEAVIVSFNSEKITLKTLINVHLHTHKSTSNHSMRTKYRSAVYCFSKEQEQISTQIINNFQKEFQQKIITTILPFSEFKTSEEQFKNYYVKNPEKPFCETFINPKLKLLLNQFSENTKTEKLIHLTQ